MLLTIHLFCDLGAGYTQYLDDNTKPLFKNFVSQSKAKSQLMIHRNESVVYYAYIRRLSIGKSPDRFFGMCVSNNGYLITDYHKLFKIFEDTISIVASQGLILEYDSVGNITSRVDKLYDFKVEMSQIADYLKSQVDRISPSSIIKLPPLDYSIVSTEEKTFDVNGSQQTILNAIGVYPIVFLLKDKGYISDNEHSFRSIILSKNNEIDNIRKNCVRLEKQIDKLKYDYHKLENKQKRTKIVAWLVSVILVAFCVLAYVGYTASERGKVINDLSTELDATKVDLHIAQGSLSDAKEELRRTGERLQEERDTVKSCHLRIEYLSDENYELRNENIRLSHINENLIYENTNNFVFTVNSITATYNHIEMVFYSNKYLSNANFELKVIKVDGMVSLSKSYYNRTVYNGSNSATFTYDQLQNGVYHFLLYCNGRIVAYHKW